VDGRREDYVVLRNGARIGRLDHVFKDMVHIREAQIHQRVPGEITVRVVRGSGYRAEDESALLREIWQRVGKDTTVAVQYQDALERSRTGKLRFVVSEIRDARVGRSGFGTGSVGSKAG
jgi:phenylacetate-CoA ligase